MQQDKGENNLRISLGRTVGKAEISIGKVAFGETLLNLKAHRSREGETYNNCYRCNKTANPFCRFFLLRGKKGENMRLSCFFFARVYWLAFK